MTLRQDVAALRARQDLTPAQLRKALYDLTGQAMVNLLTPKVGQLFTRGVYTVMLTKNPEYNSPWLIIRGIAITKNGVPKVFAKMPLMILNPPFEVPDITPGTVREDLLQAARDMLMDLAD